MKVDKNTIIELLDAAMAADYTRVRRIGNSLARLLAENDPAGAKAVQALLRRKAVPLRTSGYAESLPRDAGSSLPLMEEGQWPTTPVMLSEEVGRNVARFIEDAKNIEVLSEKGISARLGMLLYGPPGTGKSHLAGHMAAQLQRPIYNVRLDSLISSRLGETAKNVRGVFGFVPAKPIVLFLDEMDAVAKVRDDRHELGELKRVVNTVIQGLDSLPDDIVVIGATNHPHLLDSAIWRRFPYKAELKLPDVEVRADMWLHFLGQSSKEMKEEAYVLARVSNGLSGADIENISLAARRRSLIDGKRPALAQILLAASASRAGNPNLINTDELTNSDRRRLAADLKTADFKVTEISKIVGVSRQMIHRYLSEGNHAS
jgi:SpoVK/Ycf46/Vps4 family AAA+-type ATPase